MPLGISFVRTLRTTVSCTGRVAGNAALVVERAAEKRLKRGGACPLAHGLSSSDANRATRRGTGRRSWRRLLFWCRSNFFGQLSAPAGCCDPSEDGPRAPLVRFAGTARAASSKLLITAACLACAERRRWRRVPDRRNRLSCPTRRHYCFRLGKRSASRRRQRSSFRRSAPS